MAQKREMMEHFKAFQGFSRLFRAFQGPFWGVSSGLRQDKKAVKRPSGSQANTMFASLVMKPICDFYDAVYMDLDREKLQGMRKQIKACEGSVCLFGWGR